MIVPSAPYFRPVLPILGLLLALGSVACGSGEPAASPAPDAPSTGGSPATPAAPPARPEVDMGEVSLTVDEAPDNFPSDVPVYPGAAHAGAIGLGKGPMIASFTSKASPAEVIAYYDKEFSAQGWSIENSDTTGGVVTASKGRRSAVVRANATGDGTNIAVMLEGS